VSALAPLLQAYFNDRLARQRDASPHTIASYRDSFRLLLTFLHEQTGKAPSKLQLEDLDTARITAFLSYLENERGNSVRTRNARLTAVHSFFHFAALKAPECAEQIARVLSIPNKRYESTLISYLTELEIDTLLAAPDRSTWTGRRDHALLLLAVQAGLRASELANLRCQDLNLASGAWVRCHGKAEKKGAPHSPARPSRCCACGCASKTANLPVRCSRAAPDGTSPAVGSGGWSPSTPPLPVPSVRRWPARTSPRTRCVTPRRCDCCALQSRSTRQRSRSG
jgi:Phage integrase, N-terminal SAM-like domain/Phage integrase family